MSDTANPQFGARQVIVESGGRLRSEVAYCPRCNQTHPVFVRKVTHMSARVIERQRLCSACMWVVDLVVEP